MAGANGSCVVTFYFLLRLFRLFQNGPTKRNCSSSVWTVGGFCFSGVKVDSSLKEARLQLVFQSAFCCSVILFAVDELTVKNCPQES